MLNLSRRLFSARNGIERGGGSNGGKSKNASAQFSSYEHSLTVSQLMHAKSPRVRKVQMPQQCLRVQVTANIAWKKKTSLQQTACYNLINNLPLKNFPSGEFGLNQRATTSQFFQHKSSIMPSAIASSLNSLVRGKYEFTWEWWWGTSLFPMGQNLGKE